MELGSALQFLDNKSVMVTGATGFLAKIFVEKILRVQPNVKKLYLLLRAADHKSATHRLHNEQNICFKDHRKGFVRSFLKEKHGGKFTSFISEKITLVPGDISYEDLGIKDSNSLQEMFNEVDIVVNLAATTDFHERYDAALGLNTFGAKFVANFAKKCVKLKVLVHVSTGLDINVEKKIIEQKLNDMRLKGSSDKEITLAMKDLGIQRSRYYGWPNTYAFTKAMGEMVVGELKGTLPTVIIRPTIITSTFKEPFPGWAEGVRTVDSIIIGYAKGKLAFFLGDVDSVLDMIPADMVVNAMILAMVAAASNQPSGNIYQVGSSMRNPIKYCHVQDFSFRYFSNNPWIDKDGQAVIVGKFRVMDSMASFHRYMALRYLLPLKGLGFANTAFCHFFRGVYNNLYRKINYVTRMVDIYRPYLFSEATYVYVLSQFFILNLLSNLQRTKKMNCRFDDINIEKLRMAARSSLEVNDMFYSDPKCIDWDDYFMNIHIPGIVKYIFK
ncbi:hypothetical protein V6N11_068424 [Hibiscus sabdariffa]|uniref:Fatty acyl-CoA reductase n=1 Tax=Hibiscus sabdariffa TaxID=183260 RepID=A0ABR1ZKR2_9ROSI